MTSKKRLQGRPEGLEDGLRYLAFLSSLPMNSCTPEALEVMLDWTIRNDDF